MLINCYENVKVILEENKNQSGENLENTLEFEKKEAFLQAGSLKNITKHLKKQLRYITIIAVVVIKQRL